MENRDEELRALAAEHRHDGELGKALGNGDAQDERTLPATEVTEDAPAEKPARRARRAKPSTPAPEAPNEKDTNGAE